jgi:hypothetical protein
VEICSSCHPFFTGRQKLMDTAGRIERFEKKYKAYARRQEGGTAHGIVAQKLLMPAGPRVGYQPTHRDAGLRF